MDRLAYRIIDGAENMSVADVMRLLKQTDWAKDRSREQVTASMRNARCYGIVQKKDGALVGFARVISDFSTIYYLCDIVIDAEHQRQGLGTALLTYIEEQPVYQDLLGILITRNAQELYTKFGYKALDGWFMVKGHEC